MVQLTKKTFRQRARHTPSHSTLCAFIFVRKIQETNMTCKNLKERSNSLNEDGISSAEGMYNFTGFLLKVSLMSFSSLEFTMETPNFR